jgi:hypothetical protein
MLCGVALTLAVGVDSGDVDIRGKDLKSRYEIDFIQLALRGKGGFGCVYEVRPALLPSLPHCLDSNVPLAALWLLFA